MKPVFKCDYCSFMGTEQEVKEHEINCVHNYTRRSCHTCKHQKYKTAMSYECAEGKEIPEGKFIEFCGKYEKRDRTGGPFGDLIDAMFGGVR